MVNKFRTLKESTQRAVRTLLQGLGTALAFAALVAIPPVEAAVNAVLGTVHPGAQLPPGIAVSVGIFVAALAAIVAKVQNLIEGRDRLPTVDAAAQYIEDLTALVQQAKEAGAATINLAQIRGKHSA